MKDISAIHHYNIRAYGVVQGVGFRPFIYQLALQHSLRGAVCNTSGYVEIDVEGPRTKLEYFLADITAKAPPAAIIERLVTLEQPVGGYSQFLILDSRPNPGEYQLISPDLATCTECAAEIMDPKNRRFGYAFTNCTNCGPRFTIIKDIPYDRVATTMDKFTMCLQCQAEYDDPGNRRFHAQPNACPVCGPKLQLVGKNGYVIPTGAPISRSAEFLLDGKIMGIKGLGGFLLACDATNDAAVGALRARKKRPSKPFAVMVSSIEEANRYCFVSESEAESLRSSRSPIVLLKMREGASLSGGIAPGLKYLGLVLPYTPLHHLLMKQAGVPLVMTSGNLSEEPIAQKNSEALMRLGGVADYFLWHNRDIYVTYDDSVVLQAAGETTVIRRARGYAPYPIQPGRELGQVLACGAEMKGSFCLTRDNHAFVSQHIGDLENVETLEHFESTIGIYEKLFRIKPAIIAHDLHPDYLSTHYARDRAEADTSLKLFPVQHHHAHIASCMAENGTRGPVIGVALDGTGYGTDGNIWGGEILLADYKGFERLAHLEYVPLPGGDAATKKPIRIAAAYLYHLLGEGGLQRSGLMTRMEPEELSLLKQQMDKRINSPYTSSCGRLFDAVASLLGIKDSINYEAQAAIELEMCATGVEGNAKLRYPFEIGEEPGLKTIRLGALFDAILNDINNGRSRPEIAYSFHDSLAASIAGLCENLSEKSGIRSVVLSGGVFQNRLLFRLLFKALQEKGLDVLTHKQVLSNDGGIALGQAMIAGSAHEN